MSEYVIRLMDETEAREVAELWRRSRFDAAPELERRLNHSPEDDFLHFTQVVMVEYEVWVAVQGKSIVGMMAKKDSDLDKLYVEPSFQRRGIGTRLLNKAKADSTSGLILFTHQLNTKARAFYESSGFTATKFGISPPPESEPDITYEWSSSGPSHAA